MVKLELTDEQAQIVSVACEFYARVRMGQFNEIVMNTLDMSLPTGDYCTRRDNAEKLLLEAIMKRADEKLVEKQAKR